MTPLDRMLVEAFVASFEFQGPVLEIGSHQLCADGDPDRDLRPCFPATKYIGVDLRSGAGVDCVMDAADLAIRSRSVGLVVMVSTLEHVFGMFEALREMRRVVVDQGAVILTSHMDRGIHSHPTDYWRFTPEAFTRLLDPFAAKLVGYQGRSNNPQNVFAVGFRDERPDFRKGADRFRSALERAMTTYMKKRPMLEQMRRYRRLVFWRVFGSKESYRKLHQEYMIGWHTFPVRRQP